MLNGAKWINIQPLMPAVKPRARTHLPVSVSDDTKATRVKRNKSNPLRILEPREEEERERERGEQKKKREPSGEFTVHGGRKKNHRQRLRVRDLVVGGSPASCES